MDQTIAIPDLLESRLENLTKTLERVGKELFDLLSIPAREPQKGQLTPRPQKNTPPIQGVPARVPVTCNVLRAQLPWHSATPRAPPLRSSRTQDTPLRREGRQLPRDIRSLARTPTGPEFLEYLC